jgi:hypothetical protein
MILPYQFEDLRSALALFVTPNRIIYLIVATVWLGVLYFGDPEVFPAMVGFYSCLFAGTDE